MDEKQQYDRWNIQKQDIHASDIYPYFREAEIRWAFLGKNIGTETFGKGQAFARPVLILKKVYGNSAIVLPLTSQERVGDYYFSFLDTKGKKHCALLAQVRYIDGKRIMGKVASVSQKTFKELQEKYCDLIKNIPTYC